MAGFQKPQPLKAALKIALYGPAGSGKTFTSLLVAEGLARHTGKRIAFCDTEYGTAFYGQEVAQRAVHPQAFDFDVLYTKSITEVLDAVRKLDPATHGVLVIDSISHLWDACRNAFKGRLTKAGTIPPNADGASDSVRQRWVEQVEGPATSGAAILGAAFELLVALHAETDLKGVAHGTTPVVISLGRTRPARRRHTMTSLLSICPCRDGRDDHGKLAVSLTRDSPAQWQGVRRR
jgi:AAA domain